MNLKRISLDQHQFRLAYLYYLVEQRGWTMSAAWREAFPELYTD